MSMMWLWAALGLMLVLEGLLPFLSPRGWRQVFMRLVALSDGQIRFLGLSAMILGLLIIILLT